VLFVAASPVYAVCLSIVHPSHNHMFVDFFYVLHNSASISVFLLSPPSITFSVLFSLFARLNWQLACQLSSASHLSYHISAVL